VSDHFKNAADRVARFEHGVHFGLHFFLGGGVNAAQGGFEVARARGAGEPTVALVGEPNAGKSSLYNRLLGREGAIVAPLPGTTRDPLGAELELEGIGVRLLDTAGLESTEPADAVGAAARRSALSAVDSADLLVWVVDASRGGKAASPPRAGNWLLAWNKVDVAGAPARPPAEIARGPWVATSARTGSGLGELRSSILAALRGGPDDGGAGTTRDLSARHRAALDRAALALERGLEGRRAGSPLELLAEELRAATGALDDVTGRTTAEDVLDRIFARFCLGK